MELAQRVAVVTGAAAGTGRVIALALAELGARVLVTDVDAGAGEETVRTIRAAGGDARFLTVDVRDDHAVDAMVEQATRLGGPHVLVNNAGGWGGTGDQFPAAETAAWSAVLDLNLRAPMLATQRCLEPMRRAGGGAVVNIASIAGIGSGRYGSPEYGAAKAGLIRFTSSLAGLERTTGVRVNCLVPDWIGLDRAYEELDRMTPEQRARAPRPIPPAEVAAAVVRFVRDDALSGEVLVLRGGEPPRRWDPSARH
ncbi:MAG: SDR family NAD(P)-dependent oxidoreductase [Actinocatenispora sp.]